MKIIAVTPENNTIRERFFEAVFGKSSGYLALASKTSKSFKEAFFSYPKDLPKAIEWINRNLSNTDLYFCPHLLSRAQRKKEDVSICPCLWSDLDEIDPDKLSHKPSILLETSPDRYQGLWLLKEPLEPYKAEDLSRKLAYSNKADTSGWDLTQYLRIPLTYNEKRALPGDKPIVTILRQDTKIRYKPEQFSELQDAPEFKRVDRPFPEDKIAEIDPDKVLEKNARKLLPNVFTMYQQAPDSDWSRTLWALQCALLEAGLSVEETFVIAWNSATNKYRRDNRGKLDLWREVLKAQAATSFRHETEEPPIEPGDLLTDEERKVVKGLAPTFVERYTEWGRTRSDAASQYHEAGAFTILSALLSEGLVLPTSFGNLIPNLWFMILGDTTLTRKTTAMEMAIEMIQLVYEEAVVATDGSIEGILTAMAARPHQGSVFYRDEFSGLLDAMRKRDYYTGMMEALTKLYDGKYQKRVLRKDTIEIRDPIFVMLCGGIKSRIIELLDTEHIISGFIPRFIFIVADPDMASFRPAGPNNPELKQMSARLVDKIARLKESYSSTVITMVGEQNVETKKTWEAVLSPEAWDRYNAMEKQLVEAGVNSDAPEIYTPTMDRLAKSGLKAAMLLAASRQEPKEKGHVAVELRDVLHAISYVEGWKEHSIYVIQNAGKTVSEKRIDRAYDLIKRGRDDRGALMRSMHLNSREADLLLDTMEQRGMIVRTKYRKSEKFQPVLG
jgi:hypothetical protein